MEPPHAKLKKQKGYIMAGYATLKEIEKLDAQVKDGDKIHAKMYSTNPEKAEVKETPVESNQKPNPEPVEQKPEVSNQEPKEDNQKSDTSQVPEQSSDDFEQKYKVIKGRFDKDIGNLRENLATKNTEINDLHKVNLELQKRLAALENKAISNPPAQETEPEKISVDKFDLKTSKHVSPEDAEVFGSDQIDFVRRVSSEVVESAFADFSQSLNAKLESLANAVSEKLLAIDGKFKPFDERINTVQTDVHRTAEEIFAAELDRACPNWRMFDTDELFNLWLDEVYDEFTGKKRRIFLDEAIRNRDAQRVANIINTYAKTLTAQLDEANNTQTAPSSNVEKQVVPSKAGNSGDVVEPVQKETPKHNFDEYKTIEQLRRNNKISWEDADRRMAELDNALMAGQLTR